MYWHNLPLYPNYIINTPVVTFVPSSFEIKNAITVSVGKASLRRTHYGLFMLWIGETGVG